MRTRSLLAVVAATAGLISIPVIATPAVADAAPAATQALHTLDTLQVKGRAPKTGYDRGLFNVWSDDVDVAGGHNGCDTRNDILNRDLTNKTYKPGTRNCVVLTGTLADPYTGKTIAFQRGTSTSSKVQIDHVVALSDAWQKGAQSWSAAKRHDFGNDPLNLLAVDGPANQQKRDGDAATWLPANKSFRCTYVSTQVQVKAKYGVWVTAAEKTAMRTVLSNCDNAPAPQTQPAPVKPQPQPRTQPQQPSGVYYQNCSAVRSAGKAPLYRGEPGYRSALDRDNDGVACE